MSRCDVSNFSDDLKGKNEMEEELKLLREKEQITRRELEASKSQVFSLLQKLSCARIDHIKTEESQKKVIEHLESSYEINKRLMEDQIIKLKNESNFKEKELDVMKMKSDLSFQEDISKMEDESNTRDIDSIYNGNKEECNVCEKNKHEKESLEGQAGQLRKELVRLRGHLLQIEDSHNTELLENNREKVDLKQQLTDNQLQLATSLLAEADTREELNSMLQRMNNKLSEEGEEIKSLKTSLASSEGTIEQYSSSIINLHSVLEQYEKNQHILETAEVDKCRREVAWTKEANLKLTKELLGKEQENALLKSQLSSIKRQGDELEAARRECELLRHKDAVQGARVEGLERQVGKLKGEEATKVEKELMRSLLVGYFQAAASRRQDVAFIIGRFLDFKADDYDAITVGKVARNHDMFKHQSFSELFIKFLESESAPSTSVQPPPHILQQQNHNLQELIPSQKDLSSQQNNTQVQHLPLNQQSANAKAPTTSPQIPIHLYLQSLQKLQLQQQKSSQQPSIPHTSHQQQSLQQPTNPHQQLQQHFSQNYLQHNFNFLPTSSNSSTTSSKYIPTTSTTTSSFSSLTTKPPTSITTAVTTSKPITLINPIIESNLYTNTITNMNIENTFAPTLNNQYSDTDITI